MQIVMKGLDRDAVHTGLRRREPRVGCSVMRAYSGLSRDEEAARHIRRSPWLCSGCRKARQTSIFRSIHSTLGSSEASVSQILSFYVQDRFGKMKGFVVAIALHWFAFSQGKPLIKVRLDVTTQTAHGEHVVRIDGEGTTGLVSSANLPID